ncbi:MAG: hypothetical protein Pg6C_12860 [Treponemataceae bacterium]|nr:MAG: hypothetical protein Pg6C_12860 [Treponemataceae bacterium]
MSNKTYRLCALPVLCAIPLVCALSCTDSPPRIQNVRFKAVFDYSSLDEPPEYYALLFVQPEAESRAASVTLIHTESGYIWNITEPVQLIAGGSTWIGSPRLIADSEAFPQGQYTVRYTDTSEREIETSVTLSYSSNLAESSAAQARSNIPASFQQQIAVYDERENLLFFGEKKQNWTYWSDIHKEIADARFYRECFTASGYSCIVMLPLGDIDSQEVINSAPD